MMLNDAGWLLCQNLAGPFKSILCLNGALPEASFFQDKNIPIIAADGAANTLIQKGVSPHLIIGDLDSVSPEIQSQFTTLYRPDQNHCDFEKSMHHLKDENLWPALIIGLNGGYLDHILNNVSLILKSGSVFYDPPLVGFTLTHEGPRPSQMQKLELPVHSKISLAGIPWASVTTHGLQWDLDQTHLQFWGFNSFFNRTSQKHVEIKLLEGTLLVLVYLQPIQDAGLLDQGQSSWDTAPMVS